MTVLSSVINLKWSTVARNLNHKLLVSLKFISYCQNCIYQDCCNVKNPKTTAKLSKKEQKQASLFLPVVSCCHGGSGDGGSGGTRTIKVMSTVVRVW
jgi:hypothetical protein